MKQHLSISKLCVCGRSAEFPICDNSHEEEGWTCAAEVAWNRLGFSASRRYQNLARKLASHYEAALILPGEPYHAVDTLVTVVDGTDLQFPLAIQSQIQARQRWVVSLGAATTLLASQLSADKIVDLGHIPPFQAFSHIRQALDKGASAPPEPTARQMLASAFISHAIKDEPLLLPAIHYLRDYFQANFFLCADSIPSGSDWQKTIDRALHQQDIFVVLLSKAVLASHFCSFEIGMAYALKKPIVILSLDGSRPPAFVQHLQMIDLPRIAYQKPWLTLPDILLDELLNSLIQTAPSSS